jgi:hypothetical protein
MGRDGPGPMPPHAEGPTTDNPYEPPRALEDGAEVGPLEPLPGTPPGLSVSYRNTTADVGDFVTYYLSRRGRGRGRGGFMLWLLLVMTLGMIFSSAHPGQVRIEPSLATALAGVIVMLLVLSGWFRRRLRKQARGTHPLPIITIVLGPAGVVARDERGRETRLAWAAVPKVDATPKHILLFDVLVPGRATAAHVIPRRAFATPAAAATFLAAARHWHASARGGPAAAEGAAPLEVGGFEIGLPDPDPDADPPLSVTFEMTDDERRRAHSFYLAQRPAQRRALIALASLLAVLGLVSVASIASSRVAGWGLAVLLLPLGFFLMLIGLAWWGRRYRRPKPGEQGPPGPTTITIAPAGFAIARSGATQITRTWRDQPGIGATDEFLVIPRVMIGEPKVIFDAHLIPRRAFATPAAADTFLAAARQWHAAAKGPDDEW